jgi:ankyrin repeat protein
MARKKAAPVKGPPRPSDVNGQLLYDMWRDPGVLQRHLDAGHGINTPDVKGYPLLHRACSSDVEALTKGSNTLVRQLLLAGANPNSKTSDGCTPLMITSSPDVANDLLDHGADIEGETNDGCTTLMLACMHGELAVVKVLLKRGALGQMLQVGKCNHTPLSAATNNQHEEIAVLLLQELLLQPGFDINHPRLAANQPLLCLAAEQGLCRVAEFALDHGADPNSTGPDGPPLIMAAQRGHVSVVSLLCERGANVQTRFGRMNSLDEGVNTGNAKIVKTLIKHGADVNVVADSEHPFPVLHAAVLGLCDIVQLLLDAGATLDARQQSLAVSNCCRQLDDTTAVKIVKLLLPHCSSFADDNYELGNALLAVAVSTGSLQVARALHAAGADVHLTNAGNMAVVKWLQTLGLDLRAVSGDEEILPLHDACAQEHLHIAKYLLALPGAADDIHTKNVYGHTPLHRAAESEAASTVQLLLELGADVDVCDNDDTTPLMLAGSLSVVKLLLAAGADATAVDTEKQSVLHYQASEGASAGSICLLLKAGADPTLLDSDGSTAAHIAGINGYFALEALLSRAADDYRKKHPTAAVVTDTASTSSSSGSSSGASGSSVRATAISSSKDSSNSGSSSCADDNSTGGSVSSDTIASTSAAVVDTDSATAGTGSTDALPALMTATTRLSLQCSAPVVTQQQQQQQQCKALKAKQPCANCSKPTTKLCRRCAAVYYCSVECQKVCFADAQHRAQCEATAAEVV